MSCIVFDRSRGINKRSKESKIIEPLSYWSSTTKQLKKESIVKRKIYYLLLNQKTTDQFFIVGNIFISLRPHNFKRKRIHKKYILAVELDIPPLPYYSQKLNFSVETDHYNREIIDNLIDSTLIKLLDPKTQSKSRLHLDFLKGIFKLPYNNYLALKLL